MLVDQLKSDLTAAMKARDTLTTSVLRLTLSAVKEAEVSGTQSRTLSDDEVLAVLGREAKKRDEAAEAYRSAGHEDRCAKELAERDVIARYLPAGLSDEEVRAIVTEVLAEGGFTAPNQMGPAMKAVSARIAGRADGKAVAAEVKSQLAGQ